MDVKDSLHVRNSVMYTENVAGGANWEFPKCKGGQNVYNVLTFKSIEGGDKSSPRGANAP